jgi:hypothetical protein
MFYIIGHLKLLTTNKSKFYHNEQFQGHFRTIYEHLLTVLYPEHAGSIFLQNTGTQPEGYMIQQPRRPKYKLTTPQKPQIQHLLAMLYPFSGNISNEQKWI